MLKEEIIISETYGLKIKIMYSDSYTIYQFPTIDEYIQAVKKLNNNYLENIETLFIYLLSYNEKVMHNSYTSIQKWFFKEVSVDDKYMGKNILPSLAYYEDSFDGDKLPVYNNITLNKYIFPDEYKEKIELLDSMLRNIIEEFAKSISSIFDENTDIEYIEVE